MGALHCKHISCLVQAKFFFAARFVYDHPGEAAKPAAPGEAPKPVTPAAPSIAPAPKEILAPPKPEVPIDAATTPATEKAKTAPTVLNPLSHIKKPETAKEPLLPPAEIAKQYKELPPKERDAFLQDQIKKGNFTINYKKFSQQVPDATGKMVTVEYYVSSPIAFGRPTTIPDPNNPGKTITVPPVYLPMTGKGAAESAALIGSELPTQRVVELMEQTSTYVPYVGYEKIANALGYKTEAELYTTDAEGKKHPRGELMMSAKFALKKDELLQQEMADRKLKPGDFFGGHGKTVIEDALLGQSDKEGNQAIFGGIHEDPQNPGRPGERVQPLGATHEQEYRDFTNHFQYAIYGFMKITTADGKEYIVKTSDVKKATDSITTADGKDTINIPGLHAVLTPTAFDNSKMYGGSKRIEFKSGSGKPPAFIETSLPPPSPPPETASNSPSSAPASAPSLPTVPPATIASAPSSPSSAPRSYASASSTASSSPPRPRTTVADIAAPPSFAKGGSSDAAPSSSAQQPAPQRAKTAPEYNNKLQENPPKARYTILGDSLMVGAMGQRTPDRTAEGSFVSFSFHQRKNPPNPDRRDLPLQPEMTGKDTNYMRSIWKDEIEKDKTLEAIVFGGGTNDVLAAKLDSDEDTYKKFQEITGNLVSMYSQARAKGLLVVATTMPPLADAIKSRFKDHPEAAKRHQDLYEQVNTFIMKQEGTPNGPQKVVPTHILVAGYQGGDNIHLSPTGYKILQSAIESAINELKVSTTSTIDISSSEEISGMPEKMEDGKIPPEFAAMRDVEITKELTDNAVFYRRKFLELYSAEDDYLNHYGEYIRFKTKDGKEYLAYFEEHTKYGADPTRAPAPHPSIRLFKKL